MPTSLTLTLLLTFLLALAAGADQTVDIHIWPLSAPTSTSFARITYTPTNATVKSYSPPTIPSSGDEIVRLGYHNPTTGKWSGVATAASNFAPGKDKKVQLHLTTGGELFHVGFVASELGSHSRTGAGKSGKQGEDVLGVQVVKVQQGESVHLNKPVVLDAEGKLPNKEVEKSFLQKYWWVIAGFLLLQVVMGGAKE